MAHDLTLRWVRSAAGLTLAVAGHPHPVPGPLADCLLGPTGSDITSDPAADLITLEGELRATAADLVSTADDLDERIAQARAAVDSDPGPAWSPAARRRRHTASATLVDAIGEFADTSGTLSRVHGLLATLRNLVIHAAVPTGPLAEAGRGWRRNPDRPSTVIVFDNETDFLDADPQRTTGFPPPDAHIFGRGWRRDHEDDPRAPASRAGTWTIGFLDDTGEIYAAQRDKHHPPHVWLLGSSVHTDLARSVLSDLLPRMPEPNSLILITDTVRAISGRNITAALDPDRTGAHPAAPSTPDQTATCSDADPANPRGQLPRSTTPTESRKEVAGK